MEDESKDHELFDLKMPPWWVWTTYFWRGACVGVVLGYVLGKLVGQPAGEVMDTVIVVFVAAFFAALASLPRAWIEQRNRIRALRRSSSERKP